MALSLTQLKELETFGWTLTATTEKLISGIRNGLALVLFGPAGSGKSALVSALRSLPVPFAGYSDDTSGWIQKSLRSSYDLELLPDLPHRINFIKMMRRVNKSMNEQFGYSHGRLFVPVLGAADVNPSNCSSIIPVVLWMPESVYAARRSQRDGRYPGKSHQAAQSISLFETPGIVVNASGTIQQTISNLMAVLNAIVGSDRTKSVVKEEV